MKVSTEELAEALVKFLWLANPSDCNKMSPLSNHFAIPFNSGRDGGRGGRGGGRGGRDGGRGYATYS